ncbi:hypothetical protein FAK_27200 [Desulfoferula mesophila]|uniref:RES domain-containing protein n=1 Tax=Desulfoferula mesophila TaxID=3058419 RepID=A0AAU9ER96_9BACT|nr:hypothetical protein FAK_27200 [Desulfoferula mesophilus]
MQGVFDQSRDFDDDVFRNIVSLRESQNLFADLSGGDESLSRLAVELEMRAKKDIPPGMIHRGFHYTTAILYPFESEPYLHSRYGNGSYGVWYGSLSLETSIHETTYHMIRSELNIEGLDETVVRERAVYLVHCRAVLVDLSRKGGEHPALLADDYAFTQGVGARLQGEGHPGLLAPSARHRGGTNLAAFRPEVLSDPRHHCYLTYRLDPIARRLWVERQPGEMVLELPF